MPTIQQLIKKPRLKKKMQSQSPALEKCPQKRGMCLKVYVRSPKKPNSAKRKVTNLLLHSNVLPLKRTVGYIPGEGHNLVEHCMVLIRGGRAKDLPGVKYHLITGSLDFKSIKRRRRKRSKYGIKKH